MRITFPENILKGTFSVPKNNSIKYVRAKVQKINIKKEEIIQISYYTKTQVFHENIKLECINEKFNDLLLNVFNCLEVLDEKYTYGYRITNKGKILTNKRENKNLNIINLDHNKKKQYLLPENQIIPPLVDLGVMTSSGEIVKAKSDKYKQINRFLEIINDSISAETKLKIIDFGCGKSYLTFILYYYLVYVKKIDCEITGLDLKEDVVDNCNKIAQSYGYNNLKFFKGDISQFSQQDGFDMIVTLHACDTATDYALFHAIKMKCKYIFSVPCCQHEINMQLKSDKLHCVTKFGILKERTSAIFTDAIRANILQYCGYKTQVMEFVDFDASAKNLLIRAVLSNNKPNSKIKEEIDSLIKYLDVNQTLYNLIFEKK